MGRNIGALEDYKYSKALVAFGKDWTFEEMNSFLIKPASYIKGTKMAFAGLKEKIGHQLYYIRMQMLILP